MKNRIIPILALCAMPIVADAYGAYYNPYGEYKSSYNTQQYQKDNKLNLNLRFFVGLNTAIVSYDHTEIKHERAGFSEEYTTTKINSDVFDKAGFVFGLDSDYGFRLSLSVQHYDTETKVGDTDSETSTLALGAALDIPFVKKEITIPFLRLGISYISINQNDAKIQFPAYYFGFGITHNFTKNMYGILTATYGFMSDADISELNATYNESALTIGMGLGYRF